MAKLPETATVTVGIDMEAFERDARKVKAIMKGIQPCAVLTEADVRRIVREEVAAVLEEHRQSIMRQPPSRTDRRVF